MRKTLVATIAIATSMLALSSVADARDGCGSGWHRTRYGNCRPNGYEGPAYGYYGYAAPYGYAPEVEYYYPDRGYWNGDRYYRHRRYYGGGWRYW